MVRKFFVSLALEALINEVSRDDLAASFGMDRGQLQGLQVWIVRPRVGCMAFPPHAGLPCWGMSHLALTDLMSDVHCSCCGNACSAYTRRSVLPRRLPWCLPFVARWAGQTWRC